MATTTLRASIVPSEVSAIKPSPCGAARHRNAAADRRRDEIGIGLDEGDDLRRRRKRIGIVVGIGKLRQPHRPVGKLEAQAVPSLAAPALGDAMPLQHEMGKPALFQPVAHGEPGLAAADDEGIDALRRAWRALLRRRSRLRGGAHDPAAEGSEIALLGAEAVIDQIPAHALRHAQRKRRDQPAGGEIVVDIGANAHGDAEAVDGGLQRLAVERKFLAARGEPRQLRCLQPQRPVVGRVRHADQVRRLEVGRPLQRACQFRRAHRHQIGGKQRLRRQSRPVAIAEPHAAAPVVAERHGGAAGGDAHVDARLFLAEIGEPRDQPFHQECRADADGQHAHARRRGDLRGQACQRIEDRRQPALIGSVPPRSSPVCWPCARTAPRRADLPADAPCG